MHFQDQKVKGQDHQAGLLTAAFTHRQLQWSAWERTERGKLLLRCRLQARQSAWRREALRRPHGRRGAGAYRVATRTACHIQYTLCLNSVDCFISYNLKKPEPIIILYPNNSSFKGTYNFTSNLKLTYFILQFLGYQKWHSFIPYYVCKLTVQ